MEPKERIKALFARGSQVEVNRNIPVHRYFRSGQGMITMANSYFEEEEYEDAYLLYAKFITLFVEKIKQHPQYKSSTSASRSANKKSLKQAFDKAEKVKAALTEKYQLEYDEHKVKLERIEEIKRKHEENEKQMKLQEEQMEIEKQKKKEKQEMDFFIEQQKRKELEDERKLIEREYGNHDSGQTDNSLIPMDFAPPPPVLPNNQETIVPSAPSISRPIPSVPSYNLPPNDTCDHSVKPTPTFDRSLKPNLTNASETISSIATPTSNKYCLRTVLSPADLPSLFLKYAEGNSRKNVETCGVLFGNLSKKRFVITHVLIPHQSGAPDSCNTTREEDMWEFQEEHDVICLGWIHTHPSQTAFLSSVDLHTHYPYQCLMSESIAIVCSVKFNEIGYFMLTPGNGMQSIGRCTKSGFHPHPSNPPLFESCDHVEVSNLCNAKIIDWRNK